MISYYKLVKYETSILGIMFALILGVWMIIDGTGYIELLRIALILVMFLYMFMLFSPRFFGILSSAISFGVTIALSIVLMVYWLLEVDLPVIGIIDDSKMLVFVTLFYVILTYKIIRSNSMAPKYQRMPQLLADIKNDLGSRYTFNIKNISEFSATDLIIKFEIVYPIPQKPLQTIKLFLIRVCKKSLAEISITKNLEYFVVYDSEYLESNKSIYLDLSEEILKLTDQIAIDKEEGFEMLGQKFQVILKYDYKSQDNLYLESPFYRLFEYQIYPTGCHLIHRSGKPMKRI